MSRAMRRHHVERLARKRRRFDMRGASDNELAIRHPLDCGSRCLLCHGDKLLGRRPAREQALLRALDAEMGL